MNKELKVLLVNPYIYDVSAYGFWSAPLGLLYIGSILRSNGMEVSFLDCLLSEERKKRDDGRAPFVKERVENPPAARGLPKRFKRYGMSREEVVRRLSGMEKPDLVLVTCVMMYWYQGAKEVVGIVREMFPAAKIVVGGIYPSLCYEHAQVHMAEADLVVKNSEIDRFYSFVEEISSVSLIFKPGSRELDRFPYPAFDLCAKRDFVPLLTSLGCVYGCTYCATSYLQPRLVRRQPKDVLREIRYWKDMGVDHFALYDDNFLFHKGEYAKPLLLGMTELPFECSVYNPNALNAALIDDEVAQLLLHGGFREVRLGLETADPAVQAATGGKVTKEVFEKAVSCLLNAGFSKQAIQTYVLAGLPLQKHEDVKRTVDYAFEAGVRVHLTEYTPIPHTALFDRHHSDARYPIASEPLFQNNALFPFAWDGFTEKDMNMLKTYVRERNSAPASHTF